MSRRRPSTARGHASLAERRRPALNERMQHLIDIGVAHKQTFSPAMWQLALEQGEDPNDPASILYGGTPSDAMYAAEVHDAPASAAAHSIDGQVLTRAAQPRLVAAVSRPETKPKKAKQKGLKLKLG